jgi:DNA mismatch repair protein MutL
VLFERYLASAEADAVEVQHLMFPVTVDLSPQDSVVAENEREQLARLGFQVEPFGERAVRIDGVPAIAGDLDPARLLVDLLGEAGRARSAAADVPDLRRRLVTTAACQAAIKVHHPLGAPAMQALLDDLYDTTNPTTCPHGRPVVFRLSLEEIERAFRRR